MHPCRSDEPDSRAGIGQSVRRKEDARFIVGQGRYGDDLSLPGQAFAAFVRSPHAHAQIANIHISDALAVDGVLAVLNGSEAAKEGVRPIPHNPLWPGPPDAVPIISRNNPPFIAPHQPLAVERVRFAGEPLAIVVADTIEAAREAAERVHVEYEPLPAVVATQFEHDPAAIVWPQRADNIVIDAQLGEAQATNDAFAAAVHIVRLETLIQRVTAAPMEPRSALAYHDDRTGRMTLHAGSGGVVRQKRELASCLGVAEDSVRVVSGDIGGNFGSRNPFYPEFAAIAWAARRIGRPVKWTAERHESFLSDYQGRDMSIAAELALDGAGDFLGLRCDVLSNIGAHTVAFTPLAKCAELLTGIYRFPVAHVHVRGLATNTAPTASYRSSGRPEAMFVIERLIDVAASQCGFDRIELRRRNLIPRSEMPHVTALGLRHDNCAFESSMDAALALAGWSGFPQRLAESRKRGRLRGIGLANYVEISSGALRERAEVRILSEGRVEVMVGTLSSGQGHETSFAQLICEWLQVPLASIDLVAGDTDRIVVGGGSHAGRSMRLAGIVIGKAVEEIVAKGKQIAAHLLGSPQMDIEFENCGFHAAGSSRSIGLFELAGMAEGGSSIPGNLRGPLVAIADVTVDAAGFPYGAQVCEAEVDPETGRVEILRHCAVDDVGRVINPLIVDGQTHGGIAQGVGQALMEQCAYDHDTGQLLTASFMDYGILRARSLPSFQTEIAENPAPTNRLGVRSGGEGGTTPALAVVINAIVDALSEFGVKHIEMPATPERVWRALQDARSRTRVAAE